MPFIISGSTSQAFKNSPAPINQNISPQQNIVIPEQVNDRLNKIVNPKNTKDFVCAITGEDYLCGMNIKLGGGNVMRQNDFDPFAISDEVIGYLPDIASYSGLIMDTKAFKIGLGIDVYKQWKDDRNSDYDVPTRIGRSVARGIQGVMISGASNLAALPVALAEEAMTFALPGDGLVSYSIAYISANKALSNTTEPFMQETVFPTISKFTSLFAR